MCSRLYHLGLCTRTYDVPTMISLPNDTFLRILPVVKQYMTALLWKNLDRKDYTNLRRVVTSRKGMRTELGKAIQLNLERYI